MSIDAAHLSRCIERSGAHELGIAARVRVRQCPFQASLVHPEVAVRYDVGRRLKTHAEQVRIDRNGELAGLEDEVVSLLERYVSAGKGRGRTSRARGALTRDFARLNG